MIDPHQRCGYSDLPFARIYYFYTAGSRNGLEGVDSGGRGQKKKLYPRNIHFFVIEKYVEDVKREEKDVPDLLESIMRPTDHVKEELQRNLCKMTKFRSK